MTEDHKALHRAVEHSIDYLDSLDEGEVRPTATAAELRERGHDAEPLTEAEQLMLDL